MSSASADTTKTAGIVVLCVVICVQLEFLWHLFSRFISQVQRLSPILYVSFCVLFLAGLYYAYCLNETKRQAAQYRLHTYKRQEEFEREKRRLTDLEVRKLTDSRGFKEWEASRKSSRTAEAVDHTDEQYFKELERDVFDWEGSDGDN